MPTYNNQESLENVVLELLQYTNHILIVNDGSTDETKTILDRFSSLETHHFQENKGKGTALKHGFKAAEKLGYEYAITIDSDGQHYPDDLDVFLSELENRDMNAPDILLVGDRNMGREGIPGKSSKGNMFSNFWFLVVTGTQLHDTQSGYRLYPLKEVNSLKLYTRKFELEIEVIVKASWKKVDVRNIPIKVFYEEENRVTHFRPFKDITRIVFLYMWFVLVSFFYIHPRNKYQDFKEKGFKRFWSEDILKSQDPPHRKAAAIALGLFVGISPLWGLHTMLVFLLATVFKLNKVIAFLFSNISIPPLIPVIIYASYQAGSLMTGNGFSWELKLEDFDSTTEVFQGLWQYVLGSFALAGMVAISMWIVFYFLFSIFNQKQVVKP
jgi:glycosyltransferase involved in cell wall biosynthesis